MRSIIPFVLVITFYFSSCTITEPPTPDAILKKCIAYHGGLKNWQQFESNWSMISNSSHTNDLDEKITISIDVPRDKFCYQNDRRNVSVCFTDTICTTEKPAGIKDNYGWTKNFYTYIWGLPMKLKDPGTVLLDSVGSSEFNNSPCHEIYVHYENDTWTYYVNKKTNRLEGIKFIMNADKSHGEIVEFKGDLKISGVVMPSERIWFDLSKKPIGTDKMILQ